MPSPPDRAEHGYTVVKDIGFNSYCNEEAQMVGRHLHHLKTLDVSSTNLGWEGVNALSTNLTELDNLCINYNEEALCGIRFLGRLPHLK